MRSAKCDIVFDFYSNNSTSEGRYTDTLTSRDTHIQQSKLVSQVNQTTEQLESATLHHSVFAMKKQLEQQPQQLASPMAEKLIQSPERE